VVDESFPMLVLEKQLDLVDGSDSKALH